ncbi:hypothetical protein QFC24_004696 [Naganishia onofrii]|uniref:Uncharacterized protein n=1 Tax=Naganishia onofrii TaxID=1851511 RepID=A0ACC2XBG1_9TREE|nr:hypothetical protein QFC24_004696 [Naganishia onofrii]
MAVIKNLEHKVFIPYTTIFNPEGQTSEQAQDNKRHLMIHGCVTEIGKNSLKYVPLSDQGNPIAPVTPPVDMASSMDEQCGMGATCCKELSWQESEKAEKTLQFDYMVYAFGSHLPAPINIWSTVSHDADVQIDKPQGSCQGSKERGRAWLKAAQSRIEKAKSIAVIGGGALGVQFATDIAAIHGPGNKKVTLIHSRQHLLNRFETYMHDGAMEKLAELQVDVVLGARVDMSHLASREADHGIDRVIRTMDGREFEAELVVRTGGQKPNSQLLATLYPESINHGGMVTVNRHLQIAKKPSHDSQESEIQMVDKHIFVVGDTADAFGALQAGHTAWAQARLACRNIARMVEAEKPVKLRRKLNVERHEWEEAETVEEVLESYTPPRPSIKVSLGLDAAITQNDGVFSKSGKESCQDDLYSEIMWTSRGLSVEDMTI